MSDRNNKPDDAGRGADGRDLGLRRSSDPASGFVADDGASASESSVGHDTQHAQHAGESGSGIYSNFQHANPESNVGPPGAAQTSHGNAGGPAPRGTVEKAEAGSRQQAMGGAAAGGNPGTADDSGRGVVHSGSDQQNDSERLDEGAGNPDTPAGAPRRA